MRLSRPLASSLALALMLCLPAGAAMAQHEVRGDLQQEMTPAQFKAAGLDKLSATELASLNDWLQGKVAQETRKASEQTRSALDQAREEGRQEVIVKNRGFYDFGSSEPIESAIAGEFNGFGKGARFVLENGQEWEQIDSASLNARKQSPKVKIKPGLVGVWYLQIEGYNTQAKVRRTK